MVRRRFGCRAGLSVTGLLLLALVAPGAASAHVRIGTLAVDVRVVRVRVRPSTGDAFVVSATSGDRALHLTVRDGHRMVVMGLLGEPVLRVDGRGVAVNLGSPTAAVAGLLAKGKRRVVSSGGWLLERGQRTAVWRDPRLQRLPTGATRAAWVVPILVDGRSFRILGELRRAPPPRLWVWLLIVLACGSAGVLVGISRYGRCRVRAVCLLFGSAAAGAAIFAATGFAFDAEASGMRVAAVYEFLLAVGGVAFAVWGPAEVRIVAAAWLGLLGLIGGLACAQVFLHGAVLSALPAAFIRSAAALAIGLGGASLIAGLLNMPFRTVDPVARPPVRPSMGREAIRAPQP